jgi:hypothetical protein
MTADKNSTPAPASRVKIWKTTLLLISSAAFGGLAIALRNRKELVQMREQKSDHAPHETPPSNSPDEEIF